MNSVSVLKEMQMVCVSLGPGEEWSGPSPWRRLETVEGYWPQLTGL